LPTAPGRLVLWIVYHDEHHGDGPVRPTERAAPQPASEAPLGNDLESHKGTTGDRRYAALSQMPNDWSPMTGPDALSWRVCYGRRRRLPDLDGSASACKAALDGTTGAAIISDDRIIRRLEVEHEKDSTGEGYISLTFREYP